MQKTLLLAPVLFALGACGFDHPPPVNETHSSAGMPAAASANSQRAAAGQEATAKSRLEAFASRLAADRKGYVVFNRVRDAKTGGKECQVFVEMVGMTDKQAAEAASRILVDLGYTQGRRWADKNGVRIGFTGKDKVPLRVLVRSREAYPKLRHEDASSSVYVTFPVGE